MDKLAMFEDQLKMNNIRFRLNEREGTKTYNIYFSEDQINIFAEMYNILKASDYYRRTGFTGLRRYDNQNANTYNGEDKLYSLSFNISNYREELDLLIAVFDNTKEEKTNFSNFLSLLSSLEKLGFITEGNLWFYKSKNMCRINMCQSDKSTLSSNQVNTLLKIFNDNGLKFKRNNNWYHFLSSEIKASVSNERSVKNDFSFEVESDDLDGKINKLLKEVEQFASSPATFLENVDLRYELMNLLDGINIVAKNYEVNDDRFSCILEFEPENLNTIAHIFSSLRKIPGIYLQFNISMRNDQPIYSINLSTIDNVNINEIIRLIIETMYQNDEIDNEYTKLSEIAQNLRKAGFACGGCVYTTHDKKNDLACELEIFQTNPEKTVQSQFDYLANLNNDNCYVEKHSYIGGYSSCYNWGTETYGQIEKCTYSKSNNAEIKIRSDVNKGLSELLDVAKSLIVKEETKKK